MNIKERIQTVLQKINLLAKFKSGDFTHEDWQSFVNAYNLEYKTTLQDDMAAYEAEQNAQATELSQNDLNRVQSILDSIISPGSSTTEAVGDQVNDDAGQQANTTLQGILTSVQNVQNIVNDLQGRAAGDVPADVVTGSNRNFNGPGTTPQFLFGIENPMFAMNQRWNQIAANPRAALAMEDPDEETVGTSFRKQVVAYSRTLAKRYAYLHANNMLDHARLAAGDFSTNYEGIKTANVGDQYVVLRQDALIARVLQKRDLTQYFPVRYGIQDHDLVFNAFFSELSQAYQEGEIWKGSMKIENEMGHVDDAMIKMKFGPMKELERIFIGYLNKEGSDPIKWTMFEFAILHSLETAQVEQNKRRMRGIYVKPETGVAGSYLNASTGIIYTLIRYFHENKILLHADEAYRAYTKANMLDAVKEYYDDVVASCTEDMDMDNHVLYLNKLHQPWYIANVRAQYGKETDFTGPNSYLNVLPDTNQRIIWLPYLGQSTLIFMDVPGNLQFLEYIPGEMLGIKMKEDMELVKAWSTWKEGCAAAFTGRRFGSRAELENNRYEWQQIFMNKPCTTLEDGATTVDAKKGFWHVTSENGAATAITDITGAKPGIAYIIECGSEEHASTIDKTGKFATLADAYTPTKEGDYIMVILNKAGTFIELERCTGGIRKVNATLQPNIPGVR